MRSNDNGTPRLTFTVLLVLLGIGVLGDLGFALQAGSARSILSVASVALMASAAALLVGGLLGFLFGVPRVEDSSTGGASKTEPRDDATAGKSAYRANTNLEQISDWLTKVLVGASLTQIGRVPDLLESLGANMASGLGQSPGRVVFAVALSVHFAACGFLLGWLWARIYLRPALDEADRIADGAVAQLARHSQELTDILLQLPEGMVKEQVKELRRNTDLQIASATLGDTGSQAQLRELAAQYDKIRALQSPGRQRNDAMEGLLAKARGLSLELGLEPDQVQTMFDEGDEGSRIVALAAIQSLGDPRLVDIAVNSVEKPKSPFESYQALRTIQELAPKLGDEQRTRVREVLHQQLAPDSALIARGELDRRVQLARQLIHPLEESRSAHEKTSKHE